MPASEAAQDRQPGTLVAFLPNWIGDLVMATPALRALKTRFPQQSLVVVGKSYVLPTLSGLSYISEAIPWDRGRRWGAVGSSWSVWRRLEAWQADRAVLFANSWRSAMMARAAGCREVIGFARYGRHAWLSRRLYPHRGPRGSYQPYPILLDYNRLAIAAGTEDPGVRMELATTETEEATAQAWFEQVRSQPSDPWIGLNSGGAFGASKHWPARHFAEVARGLIDQGYRVVVLCGPSEVGAAEAIVQATDRPGQIHTAAAGGFPLSLGLTKALVRRLQLLVTTDSGPRHFAAAFGVPVVTLFGPTHIGWTETYFPQAIHLQEAVPCGPCQQRVCPLGHHRCMEELSPKRVLASCTLALASRMITPPERTRNVTRLLTLAG